MQYSIEKLCNKFALLLLSLCIILQLNIAEGQFWKFNAPKTDRDHFILETKSLMASGICYKEVPGTANEPTLKMQTISYCCPGYLRLTSGAMHCVPICSEDCSNGICTAPDVCECYPNFVRAGGRCEEQ